MSATLGLRSLALLVGAGWSGSYMYNNLSMERARTLAAQILLQHKSDEAGNTNNSSSDGGGSSGRSAVEALTNQVDRLTREVSRSRTQDPVVIVGGTGADSGGLLGGYRSVISVMSDLLNLLGWAVVVCSAGGVVYLVVVRKGLSLHDLFWVSQSRFNDTVSAMQAGLKRVSGVVSSVRKDLGDRLLHMEGKVEDVEANLARQIDTEVGDVKDGVARLGDEMSVVSRGVDHVHTRIDEMNEKIDGTHRGVQLLLDFVTSLAPEKVKPGTPFFNLRRYMQGAGENGGHPQVMMDDQNQNAIRPRLSQGLAGLLPSSTTPAATSAVTPPAPAAPAVGEHAHDQTSSPTPAGSVAGPSSSAAGHSSNVNNNGMNHNNMNNISNHNPYGQASTTNTQHARQSEDGNMATSRTPGSNRRSSYDFTAAPGWPSG